MYSALLSLASYSLILLPCQINSYLLHLLADKDSPNSATHISAALFSFTLNTCIAIPILIFVVSRTPLPGYFGLLSVLYFLIVFSANNYLEGILIALRSPLLSTSLYTIRTSWVLVLMINYFTKSFYFAQPLAIQLVFESLAFVFSISCISPYLKVTSFAPVMRLNIILNRAIRFIRWYRLAIGHGLFQTISGLLFVGSYTIQRLFIINTSDADALGPIVIVYSIVVFLPNLYEASYSSKQLPLLISRFKSKSNFCREDFISYLNLSAPRLVAVNILALVVAAIALGTLSRLSTFSLPEHRYIYMGAFMIFSVIYSFSRMVFYYMYSIRLFFYIFIACLVAFFMAFLSFYALIQLVGTFAYALSLISSIASYLITCVLLMYWNPSSSRSISVS